MKVIYIILAALFLTFNIYAQRNFRPGYIITNNNDSILGLIDFKTDKMNGESCHFKKSETADVQIFYPGDIAKYRYINEGKYYISQRIEIENVSRSVFLEYLLQGMMDLYYYSEPNSDREYYYFLNSEGKMISITKQPDEIVNSKIKPDIRYKNILVQVFNNDSSMRDDLNKASFNRKSLIKLTKEYHDLTCPTGESCIIFENDYNKRFIKFEFSAYAGLQLTNYSVQSGKQSFKPMKSVYPVIGGQANVSNPRWSRWISGQADLSFSAMKGSGDYLPDPRYYEKYNFDAMMCIGRINIKYVFPLSRLRPTIQAGLSSIFLFNSSSMLYREERFRETAQIKEIEDYLIPDGLALGFNAAIGLNYMMKNDKYFFWQILYEKCNNSNDGKIQLAQLKIGYAF